MQPPTKRLPAGPATLPHGPHPGHHHHTPHQAPTCRPRHAAAGSSSMTPSSPPPPSAYLQAPPCCRRVLIQDTIITPPTKRLPAGPAMLPQGPHPGHHHPPPHQAPTCRPRHAATGSSSRTSSPPHQAPTCRPRHAAAGSSSRTSSSSLQPFPLRQPAAYVPPYLPSLRKRLGPAFCCRRSSCFRRNLQGKAR